MTIWEQKTNLFLICVLTNMPPSFSHLTFKVICLQKVTGLKRAQLLCILQHPEGPPPSHTKQHQEPHRQASHQFNSQNLEVYSSQLWISWFVSAILQYFDFGNWSCIWSLLSPSQHYSSYSIQSFPLTKPVCLASLSVCRHSEPHFNLH